MSKHKCQIVDGLRYEGGALMDAAANEIERLRADLAKANECCTRRGAQMQKMLRVGRSPHIEDVLLREIEAWFDEDGVPK